MRENINNISHAAAKVLIADSESKQQLILRYCRSNCH